MIDISGITYFTPIFSFALLFVIMFAILHKTKLLGEDEWIQAIVSGVLAVIFVSVVEVRGLVESVVPWFGVVVIALFFVAFLAFFALKEPDKILKPWLVWVLVGVLVLVFLFKGFHIFNVGSNSDFLSIKDWISDGKVAGSLWLAVFAIVVGVAITRKAKD